MSRQNHGLLDPACFCAVLLSIVVTILFSAPADAQTMGRVFAGQQAELAAIFDAAYVAQAKMFEEILAIGESSEMLPARERFAQSLRMRADMPMAEMMAKMRMDASMTMPGPFDERESHFSREMIDMLAAKHSRASVNEAYEDTPLPRRAVEVIRLGRTFESRIYDVLADRAIGDKAVALEKEVQAYLAEDLSVPASPKPASLYLEHPYAGVFKDAYPKLSGLVWSVQWLQLATIEALLLQEQDTQYWGSVDTVSARFQSKMKGSPLPVELPMAPAIAPTLFTLSPDTAVILDNLNMFETVVADVVSYPNLESKAAIADSIVDQFTRREDDTESTIDYLLFALRGGIYNQGGPAIGDLPRSERNRSRMEMGMQHAMIMSTQ